MTEKARYKYCGFIRNHPKTWNGRLLSNMTIAINRGELAPSGCIALLSPVGGGVFVVDPVNRRRA